MNINYLTYFSLFSPNNDIFNHVSKNPTCCKVLINLIHIQEGLVGKNSNNIRKIGMRRFKYASFEDSHALESIYIHIFPMIYETPSNSLRQEKTCV